MEGVSSENGISIHEMEYFDKMEFFCENGIFYFVAPVHRAPQKDLSFNQV